MNNWFPTLNAALEAENLNDTWDAFWSPISYDENRRYTIQVDDRYHHVSIYRNEAGMYERPVHYDAGSVNNNVNRGCV